MINKMLSVLIYLIILSLALLLGCSSVAEDSIINREPVTIEFNEVDNGEIRINPVRSDNRYELGESVEILADAKDGWMFNKWTDDLEGTENPKVIKVNKDLTIGAKFFDEEAEYKITVEQPANPAKIELNPDEDKYKADTKVIVEAIEGGNKEFIEWTGDLEGGENPKEIKIRNDLIIGAIFD